MSICKHNEIMETQLILPCQTTKKLDKTRNSGFKIVLRRGYRKWTFIRREAQEVGFRIAPAFCRESLSYIPGRRRQKQSLSISLSYRNKVLSLGRQ
jgi:hypothetical protein